MTNEELENKISEKFVSIMQKFCNFTVEHLIQNCSPYFKTFIMVCMKMMSKEKINFIMSSEEIQKTNKMFRYFKVPDNIYLIPESITTSFELQQLRQNIRQLEIQNKDNQKLERIYNMLDMIDNLLDAKDVLDKLQFFTEVAQQIECECSQN